MVLIIIMFFLYSLISKEWRYRENISISQNQQTRTRTTMKVFLQDFSIHDSIGRSTKELFTLEKLSWFYLYSTFFSFIIILRGLCKIWNFSWITKELEAKDEFIIMDGQKRWKVKRWSWSQMMEPFEGKDKEWPSSVLNHDNILK